MQRKLTRVKVISSECRSNGHRWNAAIFTSIGRAAPCDQDTLSDTIGNSTCTSARNCDAQIPSLPNIRWRTGKRDDIGIPFGNTRARRNKRNVLHFNANEKVPRQTKSPRSFISREKPEVEQCEWSWVLVWIEEALLPRRRRRKGGVATDVRVQAYSHSLGWTVVVVEGKGEIRINGQVDK